MHWVWIGGAVFGALVLAWRLWSSLRKAESKPTSSNRITDSARQLLKEALDHPKVRLESYVRIFHPVCGGLVVGRGEYYCNECGRKFTAEELRELVS